MMFGLAATAISVADEVLNRPNHRYTVWAKRDYGVFLARAGRRAEAIDMLERVRAAQIENLGEPHPRIDRTHYAGGGQRRLSGVIRAHSARIK